jgi:hypothetical protein
MAGAIGAVLALASGLAGGDVVSLDGVWQYGKAADVDGPPPSAGWKDCNVPGRISLASGEHLWFTRTFDVDGRVFREARLRLWGAKFAPRVLVNGAEAGRGFDGFAPTDFDIAGLLVPGPNVLHVACRNALAMTDGAAASTSGDDLDDHVIGPIGSQWTSCGLWESVDLVLAGDLEIRDAFVRTSWRGRRIDVDVTVANHGAAAARETVRARIEAVRDHVFSRGDGNLDGRLDLADAISSLEYLFAGGALACLDAADANDDGSADIADPIRVLLHLFAGLTPFPPPFPEAGADPTADALGCSGTTPEIPPAEIEVPPGGEATVALSAPWPDPIPWSPEDPFLHRLTVSAGAETSSVRFGFREFWCDGPGFYLNGVRRRLLAAAAHPYAHTPDAARREIEYFREEGAIAFRFHAQPWARYWYDLCDEMGLLAVHESALWCGNYKWEDDSFWANARAHVRANVLRDRNHPSIVIWSVENEALLCGANRDARSPARLADLAAAVRGLDPTRPLMFEGDEDPEGSADIVNLHYPMEPGGARLWPDAAWWLEAPTVVHNWPRKLWSWSRTKPLSIGEFLFFSPGNAHVPTLFAGDEAYRDPSTARDAVRGPTWEMEIRAYRGLDVSGLCPWNIVEQRNGAGRTVNRSSYRKVAAFVREYESRFFGGTRILRTVYLHDDLPRAVAGEFRWELDCGGATTGGTVPFALEPTGIRAEAIEVEIPAVAVESPATLALSITEGGVEVFRDELPWTASPLFGLPAPEGLGLYDPSGTARAALLEEGIPFAAIDDLGAIPEGVRSIVVGEDASGAAGEILFAPDGPGASLLRFVEAGGQALVLRQETLGWLLPLGLSAASSTIVHARSPGHPALAGVAAEDLRYWYPGHGVSRREATKAEGTGAAPLIDSGSGSGLVTAGLLELRRRSGRLFICQLEIVSKRRAAPGARKVLRNLLDLLGSAPPARPALKVAAGSSPFGGLLDRLGLEAPEAALPLDPGLTGSLAIDASSPAPDGVAASLADFVSRGGKILLHRPSPETLPSFGSLIPGLTLDANSGPVLLTGEPAPSGLASWHLQWYAPHEWDERPEVVPDVAPWTVALPFTPADFETVEAEGMAIPATGVDPTAGGLLFYSNATVQTRISATAAGRHIFGIKGRGTLLGGAGPQARLLVDGAPIGIVAFGTEDAERTLAADLAPGDHVLEVSFVNDAYDPPEDRNLFIDRIRFGLDPDPDRLGLLAQPPALAVHRPGAGEVWIDAANVEGAPSDCADLAGQYASLLLAHLGGDFARDRYACLVSPADFTGRGATIHGVESGSAWLWSNGEMWANVRWASAAATRFTVHAGGTPLGGIYPHVELKIDRARIASFDVAGRTPAPYVLGPFEIPAGLHDVAIAFTNDANAPPEDRNLQVKKLEIAP